MLRRIAGALAVTLLVPVSAAAARTNVVRDGNARFEVLTPTLIRAEYAQDGGFENRPTMTAVRTRLPSPRFTSVVNKGWRVISTGRVTLRYRRGSGPFTAADLRLTIGHQRPVAPLPGNAQGNLGGWTRALDLQTGPVPLHDGVLSRAGWYVLDDSQTAILTGTTSFAVRPARAGAYQDWYVFGYGYDYAGALADLRALTGPAPLLPRSAFGVWFSRYYPYSESDYHTLLGDFRSHDVPLDTLSIDTDFKRVNDPVGAAIAATVAGAPGKPFSWNGWEWDTKLFGDPQRFIDWAHGQGLSLAVNIHPSIDTNDPAYGAAASAAGGLAADTGCKVLQADLTGTCKVFDWTNPSQLSAYFNLNRPFAQQGIDLFWLDWCCDGSSANAPGLTADTWINSQYAAFQKARGQRWPAFSRIGGSFGPVDDGDRGQGDGGDGAFAEHRYSIQFTGDTCATWTMLAFEAQLSAVEGNIGLPYVSDDIGSFNGPPVAGQCSAQTGLLGEHLPDDLYARWVEFGTFQPLDRLHSNHGDRLPWQYGVAADAAATEFLRLREALAPYTYTLARRAYDTDLPITGALYLQWPTQPDAYQHPSEYSFGPDVVVEPVTAPGDPVSTSVWVPPGQWVDYFSGRRFTGPRIVTQSFSLDQMPVLVRAGAVIPTQPGVSYTAPGPASDLTLTAYPGGSGSLSLYDDAGRGFGYAHGAFLLTPIRHSAPGTLLIGPAAGRFPGALSRRSWEVRFLGAVRPRQVTVNGRATHNWSYSDGTLAVSTGSVRVNRKITIVAR